jgi:hypothetical protein
MHAPQGVMKLQTRTHYSIMHKCTNLSQHTLNYIHANQLTNVRIRTFRMSRHPLHSDSVCILLSSKQLILVDVEGVAGKHICNSVMTTVLDTSRRNPHAKEWRRLKD